VTTTAAAVTTRLRRLTPDEARAGTRSVRAKLEESLLGLLFLYEHEAHLAMGYTSWKAYWSAEFETDPSYGYRLLDHARIVRPIRQLANDLPIPPEAHARELGRLLPDEQALVEVYREACASHDGRLSARVIREAVDAKFARRAASTRRQPEPAAYPALASRSKRGGIYEDVPGFVLGCGDATDPNFRAEVLRGEQPVLRIDDPPYGIQLSPDWRNGVLQAPGTRPRSILNDDRWNWTETYTEDVVYSFCHGSLAHHVAAAMAERGYRVRARIVVATRQTISGGHYEHAYEVLLYSVRRGAKPKWHGGKGQPNLWIPSEEERAGSRPRTGHPTQKPSWPYLRAIRNHTRRGDLIADFFAGSGTAMVAALSSGRRCAAIELDPHWCDVARARALAYAQKGRPA
jgi:predicted RNA methylase